MSKRLVNNQNTKKSKQTCVAESKHRGSNWHNNIQKTNKNQFFLLNLTDLRTILKKRYQKNSKIKNETPKNPLKDTLSKEKIEKITQNKKIQIKNRQRLIRSQINTFQVFVKGNFQKSFYDKYVKPYICKSKWTNKKPSMNDKICDPSWLR